jgi:type IV pilus assembly protein PilQ
MMFLLLAVSTLAQAATLDSVKVDGTRVTLNTNGAIGRVEHFVLKAPKRLVVDLYGVWLQRDQPPTGLTGGFSQLRAGSYADKVRIVFDVSGRDFPEFEVAQEARRVVVSWRGQGAAAPALASGVGARITDIEVLPGGGVTGRNEVRVSLRPFAGLQQVKHFVLKAPDRLVVDLMGVQPGRQPESYSLGDGFSVLRIGHTRHWTRFVFDQAGQRMPDFEVIEQPSEGRVVVAWGESRALPAPRAARRPAPPVAQPLPRPAPRPPAEPVAEPPEAQPTEPVEVQLSGAAPAVGPGGVAGVDEGEKYSQVRKTFVFDDADVREVLQRIAESGNQPIEIADNVSGSLTMRLVNVPWDQALEMVLEVTGLRTVRQGEVIRVMPAQPPEE